MEPRDILTQGAIITSILTMGAFLVGVGLAYWHHDQTSMSLYTGAIVANATTTVGFWLGSSAGSQKKDARLAAQQSPQPPQPSPPPGEPKP
jgi:hypothetical protein